MATNPLRGTHLIHPEMPGTSRAVSVMGGKYVGKLIDQFDEEAYGLKSTRTKAIDAQTSDAA